MAKVKKFKPSKSPRSAPTILVVTAPAGGKSSRSGGKGRSRKGFRPKRKAFRPKPTKTQLAKGALSSAALAIPLGTVAAFGMSALDGYQVSKGGWQPPVIGWRGAVGLIVMAVGAAVRSPVGVGVGAVLFGSSIPQATRAIGKALALGGYAEAASALTSAGQSVGLPAYYGDDYGDDPDDVAGELADAIEGALTEDGQ